MKVMHKKISLEPYRSRFPGITPYYDFSGGGDEGVVKSVDPDNQNDNNWGKVAYGVTINFIAYTYQKMTYMYHRLYNSFSKGIYLKKADGIWFISDEKSIWDAEPESIRGSEDVLPYSVEDAVGMFESTGSVDVKNCGNADEIFVIDDFEYFNDKEGRDTIDECEKLRGMLRVPTDIVGDKVPEYILYMDVLRFFNWMNMAKSCGFPEIKKEYQDYGGDKMLEFLTGNKDIRQSSLNGTMGGVEPTINLSISLTENLYDIGALRESDEETSISVASDGNVISMTGESELDGLKCTRTVVDEDNPQNVIDAYVKENSKDGKLLVCTGSGLNWTGEYKSYEDIMKDNDGEYVTAPLFSVLNDEEYSGKKVIVTYDNGELKIESEKIDYFIPEGITDNYRNDILRKEDKDIPIIDKESDFKPIFNEDGKENTDISFAYKVSEGTLWVWEENSQEDNKWKKVNNVGTAEVWDKRVINVTIDGHKKMYAPGNRIKDPIIVGYKFYVLTPAETPYIEKEPFNIRKLEENYDGKYEYVADFVWDKHKEKSYETVKYVLDSPCNIKNGKVTDYPKYENLVDKDETDKKKFGIFYTETYNAISEIEEIKLKGKKFNCIYYKPLFKKLLEDVVSPDLGLSRKTRRAGIEYWSGGIGCSGEGTGKNSIFKDAFLEHVASVNTPEINIEYNRGNASAFEPYLKLSECNTMEDMENYGNDYFNIR